MNNASKIINKTVLLPVSLQDDLNIKSIKGKHNYEISWSLRGLDEPYPDCGTFGQWAHIRDDKIDFQAYEKSCNRFSCRICSDRWKSQETLAIFDRLMEYSKRSNQPIIHYVVSPSPRIVSKSMSYINLRKNMYKIARRAGIIGGVAIFHYFRHPSTKNDRTEICPDQPHWHILGDSYFWNGKRSEHLNISFIEKGLPSDWRVKYIGVRKTRAMLYKTIDYCLNWSSQPRVSCPNADLKPLKIEIETWFGIMSYSSFRTPKFISDGVKCLVCEQIIPRKDWYVIDFVGWDPPDHGSLSLVDPDPAKQFRLHLSYSQEDIIDG